MKRSIGLLALAGLLPIIVLTSGYAISALHAERESIGRRAAILSDLSATLLERELSTQARLVTLIAQSPAFDGPLDEARVRLLSHRLMQQEPSWHLMSITDARGKKLVNTRADEASLAGTIVELGRRRDGKELEQAIIGPLVRGPQKSVIFEVRAPVVRNGRVNYSVSAGLSGEALREPIDSEALPEGWALIVADDSGLEAVRIGAAASDQATTYTSPIAGTKWSVRVDVPERFFARLSNREQLVIITGASIALLLFVAGGLLLFRHVRAIREQELAAVHAHRLEALGRLTGGVAHDLNNLLTPVIGGLELLRRRVQGDEKALRYIANADLSAERARKLVARLLAFSRGQPLSRSTIKLPEFFEALRDLLTQSLGAICTLKLDVVPGTPDVWADRDQFELTLMNLVVNARDALPGGGEVLLQAAPATKVQTVGLPEGDYVAVSVQDHGVGMDKETLRRAQEPFFSTKAVGEGTGLGLSMAHGFAQKSGGALRLVSKAGQGTVATIILPVAPAAARQTATDQLPPMKA